jgi:hypothetical protein
MWVGGCRVPQYLCSITQLALQQLGALSVLTGLATATSGKTASHPAAVGAALLVWLYWVRAIVVLPTESSWLCALRLAAA